MSGIRSLGYLRIEATNVEAWREFGLSVLGLAEGRGPEPGALYLRMDDFPARLIIVPGERDQLVSCGWELSDPGALAALAAAVESAGVPVKPAADGDLALRRVAGMVAVEDPSGTTHELFWGSQVEARPAVGRYGTRFVASELGLGHVVLPVGDEPAATRFFTEVLGFRLRDSMCLPPQLLGRPADGEPGWMRFLGCNRRHHSLALAPIPAPSGVVHLMIEVESLDDVGRAIDRCERRKAPMFSTLGRHTNDLMVSFYLNTPGGFQIEYGTGGRLVDDATWVSRQTNAASLWGHRFMVPGAAH
ncbi:MAG TPA: VOC family protein [Kineosporiaceae bacterium]